MGYRQDLDSASLRPDYKIQLRGVLAQPLGAWEQPFQCVILGLEQLGG